MTSLITHGKTERDRIAQAEAILSDKVNGMTVSALMGKYDVSRATLDRRIKAALDARLPATVDEYREQQNALLDEMMEDMVRHREAADALIHMGITGSDASLIDKGMAQRTKAAELRLRIAERRARLNGMDAPVRTDVSVTVTTPFDTDVAALVADLDKVDAPAPG